jgi:hypothetical protein
MQRGSLNSENICTHPKVLGNKELCEKFSCTWSSVDINSGRIASSANIFRLTTEVFTFQYDFGFSNPNLNIFAYFIFIGVPILLLIIFIYLSVPFI